MIKALVRAFVPHYPHYTQYVTYQVGSGLLRIASAHK